MRASPTGTPGTPPRTPPSASCRPATARGCRAPPATPPTSGSATPSDRSAAACAWTSSSSTSHGELPPAGTEVVLFGPGDLGEPTAQDWADAVDTISYEIVTRVGGRLVRRHVDTDGRRRHRGLRKDHPLSIKGRIFGTVVGAAGLAAAAGAVGIARQNRVIGNRAAGEEVAFGALHSPPRVVVADDAVDLHVEIDEPEDFGGVPATDDDLTVVFVHGYSLNLDCWHFQRAAYRGQVRTVFYDQRSHGRSARSDEEHCTIEQLGHDLRRVIEDTVPGRCVVVGHSMGGMSVDLPGRALPRAVRRHGRRCRPHVDHGRRPRPRPDPVPDAAARPRRPVRRPRRAHPRPRSPGRRRRARVGPRRRRRLHRPLRVRTTTYRPRWSSSSTRCSTRRRSPSSRTSTRPSRPSTTSITSSRSAGCPTAIICGTEDKITSVGHSRKLHSRIPGSSLLECEGAGHMVLLERHKQVTAELDDLISLAQGEGLL